MAADQSPGAEVFAEASDLDIRIARDGTWFHQGSVIHRKALVKLFASVLRRDGEGSYWLQTPVEKGRISVEDVPFVAVELSVKGQGRGQTLSFRTNLDDWVEAGAAHPLRIAAGATQNAGEGNGDERVGPRPYIEVRDGLEARILRPVYYELAELAVSAPAGDGAPPGTLGVWSGGLFFPLGSAA